MSPTHSVPLHRAVKGTFRTGAKKTLFLSEDAVEVLKGLQAQSSTADSPYVIKGRVKNLPLFNLAKPCAAFVIAPD